MGDADPFESGHACLNGCRGPSASGSGLIARLRFLQQRGFRLGCDTASYCMTGRHDELAALAFMLDEAGPPAEPNAQHVADTACSYSRLDSLQLLLQRGWLAPEFVVVQDDFVADLLSACTGLGQQTTGAWLLGNLCCDGPGQHPHTAELFADAAQLGSVPLLQQLRQRGCPWDATVWGKVVYAGSEALLQWLHDEGCPRPVSSYMSGNEQHFGDCGVSS